MNIKFNKIINLFLFITFQIISITSFANVQSDALVMMISISSDGYYAISSHLDGELILWDIKAHTKKIIASHANIYSAYFIKHTHSFMWQDINNVVHVQNIDGKTLLQFQNHFPVYGQVMSSNLKNYFASDQQWNLYQGIGANQKKIKSAYDINGLLSSGKLLNLVISNNNHFLVTSGDAERAYDLVPLAKAINTKMAAAQKYNVGTIDASLLDGVVIWNINTGKPLFKLPGNEVKTYATISPDNNYVISGDENEFLFVWNAHTGKKYFSVSNTWLDIPQDINDPLLKNHINAIQTLKFIDNNNDYLRFNYRSFNYAVLYTVSNPHPIQYIYLGNNTWPSVNHFLRNESIDTAPAANILVMGRADNSGIIVYKYHPQQKSLEKIWEPHIP